MRALWGLLLLLVPTLVFAAEVVVYGPGAPSPERATEALSLVQGATGLRTPSAGVVHALDLPFPSQDDVWMAGDLRALPCADTSASNEDPEALLSMGIAKVDELDDDAALALFDRGLRALPCTSKATSQQGLAQLYLFAGLAHFQKGDRARARRNFVAGLVIDPQQRWNTAYPPGPQQLWLEAKEEVISAPRVKVGIDVRGSNLGAVSVDGRLLPVTQAEWVELPAGLHFVRWEREGGGVEARFVEVGRAGGAIVGRSALRDGVLTLGEGGPVSEAARRSLAELCRNRGVDEAIVVALPWAGGRTTMHRYRASDGTVAPVERTSGSTAVERPAAKARPHAVLRTGAGSGAAVAGSDEAGRLVISVGGGLHQRDVQDSTRSLSYGAVRLRIGARLVGGLEVAFTPLLAHHRSSALDERPDFILPVFEGELRLRLPHGAVHPYGGVRGGAGLTHDEFGGDDPTIEPAAQVLGLGGVDFTPLGPRGIFFYVEGGAGAAGSERRGGLLCEAQGGLGVRW